MDLLGTISIGSDTTSLQFGSIPSGYKDLRITGQFVGPTSGETSVNMTINNVSPSFGIIEEIAPNGRTLNTVDNSLLFFNLPSTANGINKPVGAFIEIGHADGNAYTQVHALLPRASWDFQGVSRGNWQKAGKWFNIVSTRVSSIQFTTSNGRGFGAGTYLTLWGLKS